MQKFEMGNCSQKGVTARCPNSIRILMDSGCITEYEGPKLVGEVLNDFPGYGVFKKGNLSSPLSDHERLLSTQFYYLLPLNVERMSPTEPGRVSSGAAASDLVANVTKGSALEVLPSLGKGVWRVKLVINTKQLEEILSEQGNTEALIEKMRMVASSASLTPKRTKSSWGVSWKPALSNVYI